MSCNRGCMNVHHSNARKRGAEYFLRPLYAQSYIRFAASLLNVCVYVCVCVSSRLSFTSTVRPTCDSRAISLHETVVPVRVGVVPAKVRERVHQ